MAGRFIAPSEQYFDNSGNILAGGKLFFYDSGTVVAKNTFSDPGGTTANANPVILDGAGRTPDIYLTGSYKLIIKDSADVQIETRDPVLAADDTTKGFAAWNAVTVFSTLDIVRAANNLLYISLADSNQNFEPSATAAKWSQVQFIGSYNANETYSIGDIVVDSTGNIFKSRVNSNTGNTPASSATQWATSIPAVFDTMTANTINETTSGGGVTIDGVLMKDGGVNGALGAGTPAPVAGTTAAFSGLVQFANNVAVNAGKAVFIYEATTSDFVKAFSPSAALLHVGTASNPDSFALNSAGFDGVLGATTPAYITGTRVIASEGITLGSGTTYAAANTLDDYEEGTFTPLLTDGTNTNASYAIQVGTYRKVGSKVHVQGLLSTSALGSISGNVGISGLPFAAANVTDSFSSASIGFAGGLNISAGVALTASVQPNKSAIDLRAWDVSTGTSNLTQAEWSANGSVIFSAEYISA